MSRPLKNNLPPGSYLTSSLVKESIHLVYLLLASVGFYIHNYDRLKLAKHHTQAT